MSLADLSMHFFEIDSLQENVRIRQVLDITSNEVNSDSIQVLEQRIKK